MELDKTEELLNILKDETNVYNYIKKYQSQFPPISFENFVELVLQKKDMKKSDMIRRTGLHRTYAYQILSGKKKPSRDKVLRFAFGLMLNLDETQKLLAAAAFNPLYPKNKRDSIIIFCILNGKSIFETDALLYDNDELPIE